MGTGTCAVPWQMKRNVVSTQAQDGKGRRRDLPCCTPSCGGTDAGRCQAYAHEMARQSTHQPVPVPPSAAERVLHKQGEGRSWEDFWEDQGWSWGMWVY